MKTLDFVIKAITITVCVIMIMVFVSPLITGKEFTSEGRNLVADIMKQLIAIILFWLGQVTQKYKNKKKDEKGED